MDLFGAYPADRAAALSGVPKSTVHYWARKGYLVPSVSAERVKLWSFADLMALRTIYWLRQPKKAREGYDVPRSKMRAVRKAVAYLRAMDLRLFEEDRSTVAVVRDGTVVINAPGKPLQTSEGELLRRDIIDIIAPFDTLEGSRGPDLRSPRPLLRIVPRKLAGAPHIADTRVETQALHALAKRGFLADQIASLYPFLDPRAIAESVDLEEQLANNIARNAA
jgi:uncharacterized protein (DUF433 family)